APTRPRIVWALAPLGHCVGPPLLGLLGTALLAALALRAPRAWRHLALGVAPYGAWLVFGQNLAHPRHALPLLPILLLLAGRGLRRTSPRIQRGALGLVALAAVGTLLASPAWLEGGRPLDALVVWGRAHPGARIYAGASERPLRWHLPQADVRRARDLAGVRADLLADPTPPPAVWILATEVRGALELPQASGELRVLILQRE
ncbi:MAG: hypothetical protein JKY65_17910, partial [Planctomycetes bacterium]|nr:hypothetical protein [Planctomycetota bacterium]